MNTTQPATHHPDRCPHCGTHLAPHLVADILNPDRPETCPNRPARLMAGIANGARR